MAKAGKYIISAQATWIHESQDWKASFPLRNTANPSGRQVPRKLRPIKGKYLTGKPRPLGRGASLPEYIQNELELLLQEPFGR